MMYYQGVFNRYAPQSKLVLKTDCFNETHDYPVVYRPEDVQKTILVEYSQEHIDLALKKNPDLDIVQGDIRERAFTPSTFDFIFDVSTLDHIPQQDVPKVLDNYHLMLTKKGKFALITWFNKNGYQDERTDWNSTDQYYFDFNFVKSELEKRFIITYEDLVMDDRLSIPGGFLYHFEMEKK